MFILTLLLFASLLICLVFLENVNDKQLIFSIYSFVSINDLSLLTHYIRARAGVTLGLGVRDKHQHQILSTTYHSLHTFDLLFQTYFIDDNEVL